VRGLPWKEDLAFLLSPGVGGDTVTHKKQERVSLDLSLLAQPETFLDTSLYQEHIS
jgi:hypothetical protein